jgi:hypothetical protein
MVDVKNTITNVTKSGITNTTDTLNKSLDDLNSGNGINLESLNLPINDLPKLPDKIDFSKIKIPKLPRLKEFKPKKLPLPPKFKKNRRR